MNKCYLCGSDLVATTGKTELVWREHLGVFVDSSYEECECGEKLYTSEEVERLQSLAIDEYDKSR